MSPGEWTVVFGRNAERDMRRLDPSVRGRVVTALETLATDRHRPGALRKPTGAPESRLRVGDWRALVELEEQSRTIKVVRVLPRGHAYDR